MDATLVPSNMWNGLIFIMNGRSTASPASMEAEMASSCSAPTIFRVSSSISEGRNAKKTIAGTTRMSHHLNRPEYRNMHNVATPTRTSRATYGEAVRVRMNSRMAIPIMNISQPESPSR